MINNPKEFRIGNKVMLCGSAGHYTVSMIEESGSLYFSEMEGHHYDLTDTPIEGIPLTEELLRKLEFEVYSYVGTGNFYLGGTKIIKVKNYNYKVVVYASDYDKWHIKYTANPFAEQNYLQTEITGALVPFKYLHELQNHFYYFTCEELEIKELV